MKKLIATILSLAAGIYLGIVYTPPIEAQYGYQNGILVASGSGTDNTLPKFNTATTPTSLQDSLLSDNDTNVTLASGQLLLPDGAEGTPVIARSADTDVGFWWDASNNTFISVDGSIIHGFTATGRINLYSAGSAAFAAVRNANDTNTGIYWPEADNFAVTVGGALVMDWENTNAAGASADLVTISSTLGIMDGSGDTVRGLFIDLTNAVHTGGNVIGIDIDAITDATSSTAQYAIRTSTGWDYGAAFQRGNDGNIYMLGATDNHIRIGGFNAFLTFGDSTRTSAIAFHINAFPNENTDYADTFMIGVGDGTDTLAAMNGSDTFALLEIDFVNGAHTGTSNTLHGLYIDDITGDANSDLNAINIGALTGTTGAAGELEYAIQVEGGWDAAFRDVGVAFADLQAADNGSMVYCTNCDPSTSPCASAAGQTGAWAFRQNGAWECPIP